MSGKDAISKIMDVTDTRMMYEGKLDRKYKLAGLESYLNRENEATARENSSSFRRARETLKGTRKLSEAELERAGIETIGIGRGMDNDETLKTYRQARALNAYESAKYNDHIRKANTDINKGNFTKKRYY